MSGMVINGMKGDLLLCSWGDTLQAEREEYRLNTPERIRDAFIEWKDKYDLAGVLWRQERWLDKFAKIHPHAYRKVSKYGEAVQEADAYELAHSVDDAVVAVEAARQAGIKIFCYIDMYDEGQPFHVDSWSNKNYYWESKFFSKHPEFYACDRIWQSKHWGVPEYAYDQVRHYKCREELAYLVDNYSWDGVYISTRGHRLSAVHGDQYGFNEPVVSAFAERYGVDILTQNFDLEAWRRLRGEFVTQYIREVRTLCEERSLELGIGVPPGDYFGPPLGNLYLDWRTWVQDRLIDFIVVGHANIVGRHLRFGYGYLNSFFEGEFGLPPLPKILANDYAPLCQKNQVGLWVSLMIRQRLAQVYGKPYTNEMLRGIPNVNGLQWSWASKGDQMLTVDLVEAPLASDLSPEGV